MRVLAIGNVYPPHLLGGYEIIWRGVTRRLREHGHSTRVLTSDYCAPGVPAGVSDDPDVHRELRWYWREHAWPRLGLAARFGLERHNAEVFARHLEDYRPDVVTWWAMGGMSLGLIEHARREGLAALMFVHDYWPKYGPERDLWTGLWAKHSRAAVLAERITQLPTRPQLASAGRWLFGSECVRRKTLELGLRIEDSDLLAPGIEARYLRAERRSPPTGWNWRLAYIGRVVEQKGIHTALEALPLLPPHAQLEIIGDGDAPYRRRLEALATELGVDDRVRFEPSRSGESLFAAYREADVTVFPVEWDEPWGLVPLESMALGTPVIATGRGGSGDYMVDGDNVLLYHAGEPSSLAASLHALADDVALRARLQAKGYETAESHGEEASSERAVEEIEAAAAAARR